MYAPGRLGFIIATLALIMLICASAWSQTRGQPQAAHSKQMSTCQQDSSELAQLKSDVAQLQTLLNQMQANYGLVGNPTAPANHELQVNMEMWRIIIGQMQRRVSRMEEESSGNPKLQK